MSFDIFKIYFLTSLAFQIVRPWMLETVIQEGNSTIWEYEFLPDPDDFDLEDSPGLERRFRRDYDPERYHRSCKHTFDMYPDKIIRISSPYRGKKQYPGGLDCEWEIIGIDQCVPVVYCETMDLRSSTECDMDSVTITDGIMEQRYCGPKLGFNVPWKPKVGLYMFILLKTGDSTYFDRLYQGIKCTAQCSSSTHMISTKRVELKDVTDVKDEFKLLCGRKFNEGSHRIVGGETTKRDEFPWQVAFVDYGSRKPFCGGSLINNRFVLTAAHCVLDNPAEINTVLDTEKIEVILRAYALEIMYQDEEGETFIAGNEVEDKASERKEIRLAIESIIVHQFYNKYFPHDCDIALVKLKNPLDLKSENTPTPVCLPQVSDFGATWEGINATVSGWGKGKETARNTAKALQKVVIPVIDKPKCEEAFSNMEPKLDITGAMLCAGYQKGQKDACQGDSGGPLVTEIGPKWIQIGVVSFGNGCARADSPGIYSHVAKFIPWIRQKTRGAIWPRYSE